MSRVFDTKVQEVDMNAAASQPLRRGETRLSEQIIRYVTGSPRTDLEICHHTQVSEPVGALMIRHLIETGRMTRGKDGLCRIAGGVQ